ncbi:VWA domain-containing protein [Kitasatospora sp. NPDC096147]|uniref:VWA domain-containing protein n=1 Tax=Kitasatospora sp. NPDC096147 TaxID=3364093 RepID=UPI00380E081C
MPVNSLAKGANATLTGPEVTVTVAPGTVAVDVSALLVDEQGKVRTDEDLVFFNNPRRDGVSLAGAAITASLTALPADVASVVVVASVDVDLPGTTFRPESTPSVLIRDGAAELEFVPPGMEDGETILVLAELYRRGTLWKARAVGQGYAGGLAALATDYGVSVAEEPTPGPPAYTPPAAAPTHPAAPAYGAPAPAAAPAYPAAPTYPAPPAYTAPPAYAAPPTGPAPVPGAAMSFEKVAAVAPALLTKYQSAGASLHKRGLTGQRAAVYLVLDYSGSMSSFYDRGDVQVFAEQVLGLAANLDDDGTVPLVLFSHKIAKTTELELAGHQGQIDRVRQGVSMGGTSYAPAIKEVAKLHERRAPGTPALVIFQTDGDPSDGGATRKALKTASKQPLFWKFVGFGRREQLGFLARLDDLDGRTVDNADFFAAGDDPRAWQEGALYDALLEEYPRWLAEARTLGIVR